MIFGLHSQPAKASLPLRHPIIRSSKVETFRLWTPHFGQTYPLGNAGQPAELASIYVQFAANDASCTVGNTYGAGGGAGQP